MSNFLFASLRPGGDEGVRVQTLRPLGRYAKTSRETLEMHSNLASKSKEKPKNVEFFKSVVSEVVSLSDPGKSGVGRISYPSSIIAPTEQPNVSSDSNQPHTTNKEASTRQAYNHLCKHHYHHQLCQGIPATSSDCNPASRAVVCPLFLYLLLWLYPLPYPSCHPLLSDMNGCWVPMCIGD